MSTREKPDKLIEKARRLEETLPTETTLQSKFNYLPTPTLVSPFENPMQHGWMERYVIETDFQPPLKKRMTIVC